MNSATTNSTQTFGKYLHQRTPVHSGRTSYRNKAIPVVKKDWHEECNPDLDETQLNKKLSGRQVPELPISCAFTEDTHAQDYDDILHDDDFICEPVRASGLNPMKPWREREYFVNDHKDGVLPYSKNVRYFEGIMKEDRGLRQLSPSDLGKPEDGDKHRTRRWVLDDPSMNLNLTNPGKNPALREYFSTVKPSPTEVSDGLMKMMTYRPELVPAAVNKKFLLAYKKQMHEKSRQLTIEPFQALKPEDLKDNKEVWNAKSAGKETKFNLFRTEPKEKRLRMLASKWRVLSATTNDTVENAQQETRKKERALKKEDMLRQLGQTEEEEDLSAFYSKPEPFAALSDGMQPKEVRLQMKARARAEIEHGTRELQEARRKKGGIVEEDEDKEDVYEACDLDADDNDGALSKQSIAFRDCVQTAAQSGHLPGDETKTGAMVDVQQETKSPKLNLSGLPFEERCQILQKKKEEREAAAKKVRDEQYKCRREESARRTAAKLGPLTSRGSGSSQRSDVSKGAERDGDKGSISGPGGDQAKKKKAGREWVKRMEMEWQESLVTRSLVNEHVYASQRELFERPINIKGQYSFAVEGEVYDPQGVAEGLSYFQPAAAVDGFLNMAELSSKAHQCVQEMEKVDAERKEKGWNDNFWQSKARLNPQMIPVMRELFGNPKPNNNAFRVDHMDKKNKDLDKLVDASQMYRNIHTAYGYPNAAARSNNITRGSKRTQSAPAEWASITLDDHSSRRSYTTSSVRTSEPNMFIRARNTAGNDSGSRLHTAIPFPQQRLHTANPFPPQRVQTTQGGLRRRNRG